jgi:hypothetical protein
MACAQAVAEANARGVVFELRTHTGIVVWR